MIKEVSYDTLHNWIHFRQRIYGFTFSFTHNVEGRNAYKFSLDEVLGGRIYKISSRASGTSTFMAQKQITSAEIVIEAIGAEAFKNMLENIWDFTLYMCKLQADNGSLPGLLKAFSWVYSPQGYNYWLDINLKLRFLEERLRS